MTETNCLKRMKKVTMKPAKCAVDLGDGSERGLYVNQDYILQKLHRPHRAINLMYCYYPLDEGWPCRASKAFPGKSGESSWDYPYDDYFPYLGGAEGNREGEPFTSIKDVRRHGQDVILTLTCDTKITEAQMIAVAKDLRTFGRIMLRLNHEATGTWFSFNKRASYQEVADFFVKFHCVLKEYAPNVRTIICLGGIEELDSCEITKEQEFRDTINKADIWSVDHYLSLNWGWPFEVAEKDNFKHNYRLTSHIYELAKLSYKRYRYLNHGEEKPMVISEFNDDGDVMGPFAQAERVKEFFQMIAEDKEKWLSGLTLYQFRDDGRLGLEITDPNNRDVGIEQPVLSVYRDIIHQDFFKPVIAGEEYAALPVTLRWGGSEDAEGICMEINLESMPVFAEACFEGELAEANFMMELNGHWFYKAPGTTFVDFMPAFFETTVKANTILPLHIFAPPGDGENHPSQGKDWQENYYYQVTKLPGIRVRYEPVFV